MRRGFFWVRFLFLGCFFGFSFFSSCLWSFSLSEWLPQSTLFYAQAKNLSRVYEEGLQFLPEAKRQETLEKTRYLVERYIQIYHLDPSGQFRAELLEDLLKNVEDVYFAVIDVNPIQMDVSLHLKLKNPALLQDFFDQSAILKPYLRRNPYKNYSIYRFKMKQFPLPFFGAFQNDVFHFTNREDFLKSILDNTPVSTTPLHASSAFQEALQLSEQDPSNYAFLYLNFEYFFSMIEKIPSDPLLNFFKSFEQTSYLGQHLQAITVLHSLKMPKASTQIHFFLDSTWPLYYALRLAPKPLTIQKKLPSNTIFALCFVTENIISYGKRLWPLFSLPPLTLGEEWTINSLIRAFGEEIALFMVSLYPEANNRLDLMVRQLGLAIQIKQPESLAFLLKQLETNSALAKVFPTDQWQEEEFLGTKIRWNYPPFAPFPLSYTFYQDFLLIAFSPEVLKNWIQSDIEERTTQQSEIFQQAWRNTPADLSRFLFIHVDVFFQEWFAQNIPFEYKDSGIGIAFIEQPHLLEIRWTSDQPDQMYIGRAIHEIFLRIQQTTLRDLLWKCRFHLQSIHRAVQLYKMQHQRYPASFDELYQENFLSQQHPMYCPYRPEVNSYQYCPPSAEATPETILCYTAKGVYEGRNVLYLSGEVLYMSEEEFIQRTQQK